MVNSSLKREGVRKLKNESSSEFGAWMSRLREERHVGTQQVAADRIGCSRVQLARWEAGMSLPSGKYIRAIADAYAVDANEVGRRAGYPIDSDVQMSPWVISIARRIERKALDLPKIKRDAIERAIDNLLTAAS